MSVVTVFKFNQLGVEYSGTLVSIP